MTKNEDEIEESNVDFSKMQRRHFNTSLLAEKKRTAPKSPTLLIMWSKIMTIDHYGSVKRRRHL
jgi:hypothetical protein